MLENTIRLKKLCQITSLRKKLNNLITVSALNSLLAHFFERHQTFWQKSFFRYLFLTLKSKWYSSFYTKVSYLLLFKIVMAARLSRPGKSREGPGTGQDLETLKVPWFCGPGTKEVHKSRDFFFEGPGTPWFLFLDRILLIRFKTKVHHLGLPLRFITKVHNQKLIILPKNTSKNRKTHLWIEFFLK